VALVYQGLFFFKFISVFSIVILLSLVLQLGLRWLNWKKCIVFIILINCFLAYLIYTHFIIAFFGYFTDPVWYQKSRPIDYIQLSHEPAKWGWGSAKKDHFTYHNVKTVLWFKNDGPFATSFLFFQMFLFVCLFLTFIWWVVLYRRVYTMKEVPMTFTTYCVSSLRQFFHYFLFMYGFIFLSFLTNYWRFPVELNFVVENSYWVSNFLIILLEYPAFILTIMY
jgi:hypothetical protein